MKKILLTAAFASAALFAGAANASDTQANVALCAAALDDQGLASADEYRARFKNVRGGSTKKISVRMIPVVDGKDSLDAVCKIKGGEVVEATIKA